MISNKTNTLVIYMKNSSYYYNYSRDIIGLNNIFNRLFELM